jgi:hypothetical protein
MICGLEALVVKAEAVENEEIRLMEEERKEMEKMITFCEREIVPFLERLSNSPNSWDSEVLEFMGVGGSRQSNKINAILIEVSGNDYSDCRKCYKPKGQIVIGKDFWGFRRPTWRWEYEDVVELNALKEYLKTFCWDVTITEDSEGAWMYGNGYCYKYTLKFKPIPSCI